MCVTKSPQTFKKVTTPRPKNPSTTNPTIWVQKVAKDSSPSKKCQNETPQYVFSPTITYIYVPKRQDAGMWDNMSQFAFLRHKDQTDHNLWGGP